MQSRALIAVAVVGLLAVVAYYLTAKGATPAPAAQTCPAASPYFVAEPMGDYWPVETLGEYTCDGSQIVGWCNQPSAAAAEAACLADPGCAGYVAPSSLDWAAGNLTPGTVILTQSTPGPSSNTALPKNNTFYRRVTP